MTNTFIKNILRKNGIIVQTDLQGNNYYFMDATKERITEDEAMEVVEEYLVSAIAFTIFLTVSFK